MFLPVFVHPGKRGPSPVKKSPEKSTAKGGPPPRHPLPSPPHPPSPLAVALTSHPRPLFHPPPTPTAFPVLSLSPPALRSPRPFPPGQSNACLSLHSLVARKKISTSSRPRPPARRAAFFPHTCVKASRSHTHVCVYAHAYTYAARILVASARGGDVRVMRRRAEDGRRCFRVCNLDSQSFHILLPLEPIHK